MMSKLLEEKLKFPSQKRKTDEHRRAVIFIHRLSNPREKEFREEYFKQKEEDIRRGIRRGRVTRFIKRKKEEDSEEEEEEDSWLIKRPKLLFVVRNSFPSDYLFAFLFCYYRIWH
ncbi:hypothetical protein MKW92_015882 [Papaver armeniacum]|nr:hypothetical protein MKW92_015882 [Papaver armeniacum]